MGIKLLPTGKMACYECSELVIEEGNAIGCSACHKWAHKKCAHINSLSKSDLKQVNWICTPCLDILKYHLREGQTVIKQLDAYQEKVQKKLDEIDSKMESVNDMMTKVEKSITQPMSLPPPLAPPSYANAAKKHLLVLKSTDDSQKATDRKEEISTALDGLQIVDAKFKHSGKVVLNFENEAQRDEAAARMNNRDDLTASRTKTLLPKIMVCNVNAMENKDILETIIAKK